jgi:hypothetical protein
MRPCGLEETGPAVTPNNKVEIGQKSAAGK